MKAPIDFSGPLLNSPAQSGYFDFSKCATKQELCLAVIFYPISSNINDDDYENEHCNTKQHYQNCFQLETPSLKAVDFILRFTRFSFAMIVFLFIYFLRKIFLEFPYGPKCGGPPAIATNCATAVLVAAG